MTPVTFAHTPLATPATLDSQAPGATRVQGLAEEALRIGIEQARILAAPIQPFLLMPGGSPDYLLDDEVVHPVERAVRRLLAGGRAADAQFLALAMHARLPTPEGPQRNCVLVIACARAASEGEAWAQAYRPGRWYRSFRLQGQMWPVGPAIHLFHAAAETA